MKLDWDESESILVETFADFFARECPSSVVRDAEPRGFSPTLWRQFTATGAPSMCLPLTHGGVDASALDATIVAEACGAALAPIPFAEVAAAAPALVGNDAEEPWLSSVVDPPAGASAIVTLALSSPAAFSPTVPAAHQLVPAGAIAAAIVLLEDDALVLLAPASPLPHARNLGAAPLGMWTPAAASRATRTVLARGASARARFDKARAAWHLLRAAALVGLAQRALDIGVAYAASREQFGVAIGSFQSVAHALASCATRVDGARLLVQEAACATREDEERSDELTAMAFAFAAQTATRTAGVGLHVHGGYGFTLEYDIQLYYRRAATWALTAGSEREALRRVADLRYGDPTHAAAT